MNYPKLIGRTRARLQEAWAGKLILEAKRVQDQDDGVNTEGKSWTPFGDSCHLLWMLDEMELVASSLLPEATMDRIICQDTHALHEYAGTISKLNRWLGFVQGALFAHGMATIDELREDVKSCL